MATVAKEVIGPGTYWYTDQKTGKPRKLTVTPELVKYWHEQGNAMISARLPIPVPMEHDFDAHPMTPAEQLQNNAGWVRGYSIKDGRLWSDVEITDEGMSKKLPHTVKWTSPWFNSFTDGSGKEWKNVISHLALTTRPRVVDQQPFGSVAAALSVATETKGDDGGAESTGAGGYCLSRAGLLGSRGLPTYPVAFSMYSGAPLAADTFAAPKKGPPVPDVEVGDGTDADDDGLPDALEEDADDDAIPDVLEQPGDIGMEELLCDLLQALGVPMPDESNEAEFKRHLYEAVMSKIKELTSEGMGKQKQPMTDQNQPPGKNPHASQPNPLIGQVQQEQQPMYMSLEEINKLPDPMRGVALAMYNENVRLRAEVDAGKKVTDSLRDAKLKEVTGARATRITLLGKLSPKVKADLDTMAALPSMALSMGDGGAVIDPMAYTLSVLEKGLSDLPTLLTTDQAMLSVAAQPQDADMLSVARADALADDFARQMGCPPERKAS